jgi:hypothetical protein
MREPCSCAENSLIQSEGAEFFAIIIAACLGANVGQGGVFRLIGLFICHEAFAVGRLALARDRLL